MFCCITALGPMTAVEGGWILDKIVETWSGIEKEEHPSIRVLIAHDIESTSVEIKGTYNLFDPHPEDGKKLSPRFKGKKASLYAIEDGLAWGEEFPGTHQIAIVPDNYNTKITVNGVDYFGSIFVYRMPENGTISIVNHVLLEDYLDSLLSPMYRNEMPQELLTALAITARTNAYYQVQNSKSPYWDVDANQVGYKGTSSSTAGSPVYQAVKETQFMVLSRNDGSSKAPFPVQWGAYNIGKNPSDQPVYSKISILEAESMAKKGMRANTILAKAFPQTAIEILKPTAE